MAQRYGGKYSPDGNGERQDTPPQQSFRNAQVDPVGIRANLMFLPPAILTLLSLNDGATGLALGLIAAGLWTGGAFLLREGLKAEAAYAARKVARKPALPRKILAALLAGGGAALAAWKAEPGILIAAIYGAAAAGLHITAFGIDPLRDKGVEGVDDFQQSRVARAVDEAEQSLAVMKDAALRARDRRVEARVEQFQEVARELFRTVEEDPRDLTAARKYLTVYLQGARDATVKFADIYARSQDTRARADYLALLDDLEQNFAARTRKMLVEDRTDLTIEIDVLRDRLQREGVHLDRN
ncbi:5-bromo-4-chloroindolyl phosphate hydrolysis family protein [Leisingera daeponensis]|uniref:5-bromo-4-chloroindolyl phosphate hydrolysis family protein n=1 Tax=Leisingera daeponensis TaxID=405746 RepID=A0ABS7NCI1_9RHOB|nr:5-bromo-4-chloroindolyl phosphate hydrolysis family protein [Leisingera daeponensis]MBY6138902.1 5-bromo-4-chloroindolyl phosphate hydrolysis family protein [Leisingera daeponensis]